jgi:hypothetical protein
MTAHGRNGARVRTFRWSETNLYLGAMPAMKTPNGGKYKSRGYFAAASQIRLLWNECQQTLC